MASQLDSSIILGLDDGPGVVSTEWISNDTDFLKQNNHDQVRVLRSPSDFPFSTFNQVRKMLR